MTSSVLTATPEPSWQLLPIEDIIVHDRQRKLDPEHVKKVQRSFHDLGGQLQLQPIIVTDTHILIDGAHRLEAAKRSGWTHISAIVLTGLADTDRHLLEAEANLVRKELSPIEIFDAWHTQYEPVFRAKAKQRQAEGGTAALVSRGVLPESPVPSNTGNWENSPSSEPVSIVEAARETTGMGYDWLNKIQDIREIAHSTTAPEPLRQAARIGLEKLSRPRAKVEPIYKELLHLKTLHERQGEDPETRRARELEKILARVVDDSTILAERLSKHLADDLHAAAKLAAGGAEQVRAVRVALTHALAAVVAVECRLHLDPSAALTQYGTEITRLLSELTVQRLTDDTP